MPSAVVGALKVILSADTAQYSSALQKAGKEAAALSRDFGQIGRQMTQVGSALTKTLTLPLVALGAGAVKTASDFESSFAGIRKTVGDATDAMGELTPIGRELQQGMRDLAKEIPVSVDELNRIGEAAGQLGIKSGNILGFTRVMADLAATTSLSSEEAATSLAQLANITQMPQDQFDRLGSTIVGLGNNFATNETKIVDFGLRIAGAGKLAGLSEHQILAIGTAMASIGVEAEAGGTAVQKVLNDMTEAVATGNKSLSVFAATAGMSAQQFAAAYKRDAAGAFTAFVNGLGREGDKAFGTLNALGLGNERVVRAFLSLGQAGTLLNDALAEGARSWQQNTALAREAEQRYRTFASQMTLLWNQIRDVGIELGTALLPAMKSLVSVASSLVPVLELVVKGFTALPTWVQGGIVAFAGFVAAIGPALWVLGQLITSIGTVIGAFKAKGIAMRAINAVMETSIVTSGALAGALRVVTAALVPLAAAITAVWAAWKIGNTETVKNSIAEWGLSSHNATAYLYRLIAGIERMTPEQAKAAVAATAAAESLRGQAKAIVDAGQAAEEFVGPLEDVSRHNQQLSEDLEESKTAAEAFAKSLRSLGGADALAGAREVVKQLGALDGPLNVLPSKLAEMAARLREGAEAALLAGKADLANQYTKLADTLDPIIQFQQRYNVTIGDYVTMAPQAASWTEAMVEQLHTLGGTVVTIGPAIQSSLILPWARFKETVKDVGPSVERTFANISDAVTNLGSTILGAVQGGGSVLKSIGSSLGQSLGKDLSENLGGFLKKHLGDTLGGAVAAVLPGLGALLGPALSAIGGGLKKLFGIGINEEVRKANAEIQKVRDSLTQTHGPLDVLEKKANAVGLSFAENWGHQGKAGLDAFNKLVDEFNKRWEELQAKREQLESDLDSTRGEFDTLIGKAKELGYEFDANGKFIGVTFESVRAKADEFGVSVDGLGPRFRQQGIDLEAMKIINAFTLLSQAGGDVGGILFGLKDEIGTLIGHSIEFGTTVPKNMEPWIKELIRTDQLVDENGHAITDLSLIKFGEPVKTEFEKISSALLEVVNKLNDILAQIAAIPTNKTFTVTAQYNDPGPPEGFGDASYTGQRSDDGFAVGTLGRLGKWFGEFPKSGFSTMLHGVEAVITPDQAPAFAMDVLGASGALAAGAGGGSVDMSGLEQRLYSVELLLREQPRQMARAVNEVVNRGGRR